VSRRWPFFKARLREDSKNSAHAFSRWDKLSRFTAMKRQRITWSPSKLYNNRKLIRWLNGHGQCYWPLPTKGGANIYGKPRVRPCSKVWSNIVEAKMALRSRTVETTRKILQMTACAGRRILLPNQYIMQISLISRECAPFFDKMKCILSP